MLSPIDFIKIRLYGVTLILLFLINNNLKSQEDILSSRFTFNEGAIKTAGALDLISRKTGFYFTYDSKIIDGEKKTELNVTDLPLQTILDNIFENDSIKYSIIGNHIIIFKNFEKPQSGANPELTQQQTNISGKIIDSDTGDALPYATIGIISKGNATVTNLNGEFVLNIPPDCINDSLSVSYLGYINRFIPVRQALGNSFTIKMIRDYIPIPEIIIRSQSPQEILKKTLAGIPKNYGNSPSYLTGFYREAVIKRSELQVYSEAVLQIYKSAYSGSLLSDQIRVVKSRKIENTGLRDTLTLRLKAGLSSCLELDGIQNTFDFLDPANYKSYNYSLTDIVTLDEESAYVIEFVQKENIDIPLFRGSLYINIEDFSVLLAEFELNPDYIHKSNTTFVANATRGYSVRPAAARYRISYRYINGQYFLSHVRGDLDFVAKERRKLFNTPFKVFFELAITNVVRENVSRFERDEITPLHTVFSKTITGYDPDFWGDQDFLKPEDDLLDVLQDMNVKLFEFSPTQAP